MTFAEKIEKHITKRGILEIGEVKLSKAYLYSHNSEVVVELNHGRKTYNISILNKESNVIVFEKVGSLSNVLHSATGYLMTNPN